MPPRAFGNGFGPGFGGPLNVGALLLKVGTVGPDPLYQDGDVLVAINRRRTRSVFAQQVCSPRSAPRNSAGRIQPDALARHLFDEVYQYRFDRVSATTVTRTNLWTNEVDVIGPTPNEKGEHMDVPLFVARRMATPGQVKLFGAEGAEFWYGGSTRETHADLDRVWAKIEAHSPHREADFPRWPFGDQELRSHLAIEVDDFDDAEEATLASPTYDTTNPEQPVLIRKRARHVNWRQLPGMSAQRIAQVEDRTQLVDIRAERKHPRGLYVQVK